MSDQRQMELFKQIRAKLHEQGFSPNFALNNKVVLENALQTYIRKVPIKVQRKETKTQQQTLQQLQKIKIKAMFISILILFVIIPFVLILWSVYQSFATCDGLFGDSIEGYLRWHEHYEKFIFKYGKNYKPKNVADLNKYPWMVRLALPERNTTQFACSGFLINDRDILTAGHCFNLDEKYVIHLGGTPTKNYKDAIRLKNDQYEVFIHPKYNHTLCKNDIALIKLNKPIKFSDTIHPVRLSFESFVPKNLTLTGWNSSDPFLLPKIKETVISTIPIQQCETKTNKTFEDKVVIGTFYTETIPTKICGGDIDTKITPGDSGMSIQSMNENGPIAYGIISVGTRANKPGSPQIFTNIYPYLHWILCNAGDKFCKIPDKK